MKKLISELTRLYFQPGQQKLSLQAAGAASLAVLDEQDVVRCLAGQSGLCLSPVSIENSLRLLFVEFKRTTDWEILARLFQGVQEDLDLPAPAISVSGEQGFGLWFSLQESVSCEVARTFLGALQRKYLMDIPADSVSILPATVALVPSFQAENEMWSAFIDPTMGSMFIDEPWLDMAPNMDKQAEMLAGLASIKPGDFRRALNRLLAAEGVESSASVPESAATAKELTSESPSLGPVGHFDDPRLFLLAVMNDPRVSLSQRMEAARALLPYGNSDSVN